MVRWSIPLSISSIGSTEFSNSSNSVFYTTSTGTIVTCRLFDQRVTTVAHGYSQPIAAIPTPDGLGIIVVEKDGAVLQASRNNPSRIHATVLTELSGPLASARLDDAGTSLLVLEAKPLSQLLSIDLGSLNSTIIAGGFKNPIALVVTKDQAILLDRPAAGQAIVAVDRTTGAIAATVAVSNIVALVSSPPKISDSVIAAASDGSLALVSLVGAPDEPGPVVGGTVNGLSRWGSLILASTPTSIEAVEWGLDAGALPIESPLGPIFVGGYARLVIDPGSISVPSDDVQLLVEEGPLIASVSGGVEPAKSPGKRIIMLLAEWTPGEFNIRATRISSGAEIGRVRFRITRHWPDEESGPPVYVTGQQHFFAAWGGGPLGAENIGVHPAPEVWRVGIVFVSTRDRGLPGDLTAAKNEWQSRLTGPGLSVRGYYEEVSFRNTPATPGGPLGTTMVLGGGQSFGPVDMDSGWGDLFEYDQKSTFDAWRGWNPKNTTFQELAGSFSNTLIDAGISHTILPNLDAVVFVIQTASDDVVVQGDDTLRAKFVWPQESGTNPTLHWLTITSDGVRLNGFKQIPAVVIPTAMPSAMPKDNRLDLTLVLCHELGHTFGCEDLYDFPTAGFSAEVDTRLIGDLDVMGDEFHTPHFSLPNRMRLGWIDRNWISSFDFSVNPNGAPVTLHAIERMSRSGPPPGRKAGIEIRIRDGWNYYFEYRRTQAGELGDQQLGTDTRIQPLVLGTDVIGDGKNQDPRDIAGGEQAVRPRILLLPADVDGEGPVLSAPGQDYAETDETNPVRQHDFRLEFDHIDAADNDAIHVNVVYEGAARVDLAIRPAPGRGDYKSPDVDLDGPAGPNTVAKGRLQQVKVRVKNRGSIDAQKVTLKLFWLPFTTKAGDWNSIPSPPPQDIGAGLIVEFQADWTPPAELQLDGTEVEHFCIKAQIDAYVDPRDPSHNEVVVANNWAQSNFNTDAVADGSPSERRVTAVALTNTVSTASTYRLMPEQDSAFFRAYLGKAWVHLKAGETAAIEVAYESLAGDPLHDKDFRQAFGERGIPPNLLSVTSFLVPPQRPGCPTPRIQWGAGLSIRAGHRTQIRDVAPLGEVVRGFVDGFIDGSRHPVTSGKVNVVLWFPERPGKEFLFSGAMEPTGRFDAPTTREITEAFQRGSRMFGQVFYLGTPVWSPSRTAELRLR